MQKTEFLKNAVPAIIGLAIVLVMLEIFFHFVHLESDVFHIPDSQIGISHIPEKEGWYVREEFTVFHKINSDGFVDREFSVEKPAGTYRIAVLGDSFTEALQVPLEQSFHKLLEAKLNENNYLGEEGFSSIEVMNFGVSDIGTAQEFVVLKKRALKYDPDMIILMMFPANDISNNYIELDRGYHKPYFEMGENESLILAEFKPAERSFISSLAANSKLVVLVYNRLKNAHRNIFVEESVRLPGPETVNAVFFENTTAEWEIAWDFTEKLLLMMQSLAAENNAEFLVVNIPHPMQVNEEFSVDIDSPEFNLDYPDNRIEGILRRNKIGYLFVKDRFVEREELMYFISDGHFNQAGHRAMAEEIFKHLISKS